MQRLKTSRRRKVPSQYKPRDKSTSHFDSSPKQCCKRIYYEVYNKVIASIKERFNQSDYRKYPLLHNVPLKAVKSNDYTSESAFVKLSCKEDFNQKELNAYVALSNQVPQGMELIV